jgi:hypothetical protein
VCNGTGGECVMGQEGSVCNGDRRAESNGDRRGVCVLGQEGSVCNVRVGECV